MSILQKLLSETTAIKESHDHPEFHYIHVDAHALNPSHNYEGGPQYSKTVKALQDHLHAIGQGHIAHRVHGVGYDDMSIHVHHPHVAHAIAHALNSRIRATQGWKDNYSNVHGHAAVVQKHTVSRPDYGYGHAGSNAENFGDAVGRYVSAGQPK